MDQAELEAAEVVEALSPRLICERTSTDRLGSFDDRNYVMCGGRYFFSRYGRDGDINCAIWKCSKCGGETWIRSS